MASVPDVGLQRRLQTRCRGGHSSVVVTVSLVTVERQVVQVENEILCGLGVKTVCLAPASRPDQG